MYNLGTHQKDFQTNISQDTPTSSESPDITNTPSPISQPILTHNTERKEDGNLQYKIAKPLAIYKYKLKYCLSDFEKKYQKMENLKASLWTTIGIFLTVLLTSVTATYHEYGFSSAIWQGFFFFVEIVSFLIILILGGKYGWTVYKNGKLLDIQSVVDCVNAEDPD